MTRCLVIVSDRHDDFDRLVTPPATSCSWSLRDPNTPDVWIVQSERVFNAIVGTQIFPALESGKEICVALHPVDWTQITTADRLRVKQFSHVGKDRIWDPHGVTLVNEWAKFLKDGNFTRDAAIATLDIICDIIWDVRGEFRRQSIRCLTEMYDVVASENDIDKLRGINSANANYLSGLLRFGLSEPDIDSIDGWLHNIGVRSKVQNESASANVSLEKWIDQLAAFRDILLGGNDADGIIHRLK